MVFTVFNNPNIKAHSGFTMAQFRALDNLYCRAAGAKALRYRTVDCDFEEKVATYTYYVHESQKPLYQFVIKQVGPNTMMYEVYKEGKGRIKKSGVFDRAFEKLRDEIEELLPKPNNSSSSE